jgi:hypothetical protein
MELGKPSPVSIILSIVMIGVLGYLTWSATQKTDDQNYTKGAVHNQSTVTIAPVEHNYPLALPRCGRFLSIDPAVFQPKPEQKGKK